MPTLVLVADGKETRYELAGRPVVVGRSVECDVQVSEERASRRHFQVEPTERGWVLRDLDSSNGTALNGYGISQALLTPGDVVELGGVEFRFEGDGAAPAAKAPRAPRKRPSAGPAWAAALVLALAAAATTDEMAVGAARDRDREIRKASDDADHEEFRVASRQADPAEAERALDAWLAAHPAAPDATEARARLAAVRGGRTVREEAGRDWEALQAAAPGLAPAERRWRMESLVRRWSSSPAALAEIRRRAAASPAAAPAQEDSRVLFQRRKREADAALSDGNFGVALALWSAHAASLSADDPVMADVREEYRRVERGSAVRGAEVVGKENELRGLGRADEALKVLREALPPLEGTGGGRRVAARLGSGGGLSGIRAPEKGAASDAGGYARQRALYLRAREAEQFVALKDYRGAAGQYGEVAAAAAEFPGIGEEMRARAGWLGRVADLLDAVRAAPGSWKGKPWPESWETVPAADLVGPLQKAVKRPEDRLALASFAWDQGLRPRAVEAICAALDSPATHAEAERLWSQREGVPVPEGGWVAEKGEVLSRGEWKRRRNSEAILRLREREVVLVRRLHETALVRGIDHFAALRAELDKRRALALELIFDEVKYFYPYQDRMGEYTPVQREVGKRVEAVRDLWEDKARLRTRPDAGAAGHLKDFDEAARQLKELGGEATAEEAEVARLRLYLDRDLDVRSYFVNEEELARREADVKVLKENATRKTAADDPERRQVEVTNEYRIMFGRRALLIADRLVLSARAHGVDMTRGGFFSHFNERLRAMKPGEKIPEQACGCSSEHFVPGCTHGPQDRIRKQGYESVACSENIHAGSGDPEGAHQGWIHSSGHHRNILMADWKEMGTGRAGSHWTQNFGVPLEPETAAPDDGAGADPWDGAGGRGTGGDGNPPREK